MDLSAEKFNMLVDFDPPPFVSPKDVDVRADISQKVLKQLDEKTEDFELQTRKVSTAVIDNVSEKVNSLGIKIDGLASKSILRQAQNETKGTTFSNPTFLTEVDTKHYSEVKSSSPRKKLMAKRLEEHISETHPSLISTSRQKRTGQLLAGSKLDSCTTIPVPFSPYTNNEVPMHLSGQEYRKNRIEFARFPGVEHINQSTVLPGNTDTKVIISRIRRPTRLTSAVAQKEWDNISQSQQQAEIVRDAFWWFFLHYFQSHYSRTISVPNLHKQTSEQNSDDETANKGRAVEEWSPEPDKEALFSRISDNFVSLFLSADVRVRDSVFSQYHNDVAQAVCGSYFSAFPNSSDKFGNEFRSDLISMMHEWMTGFKPNAPNWRSWDITALVPSLKRTKIPRNPKNPIATTSNASLHKSSTTFSKPPTGLPKEGDATNVYGNTADPPQIQHVASKTASMPKIVSDLKKNMPPIPRLNLSQVAEKKREYEKPWLSARVLPPKSRFSSSHASCKAGKQPRRARAWLDIYATSPLISSYLARNDISRANQSSFHVRRTDNTTEARARALDQGYEDPDHVRALTYREITELSSRRVDMIMDEYQTVKGKETTVKLQNKEHLRKFGELLTARQLEKEVQNPSEPNTPKIRKNVLML